jgi:hypothetical protein
MPKLVSTVRSLDRMKPREAEERKQRIRDFIEGTNTAEDLLNPVDWPQFLRSYAGATAWFPLEKSRSADVILSLEEYHPSLEQPRACGFLAQAAFKAEILFQAKSLQRVNLALVAAEYDKLPTATIPTATTPPVFTCLLICGVGEIDLPRATPVLENGVVLAHRYGPGSILQYRESGVTKELSVATWAEVVVLTRRGLLRLVGPSIFALLWPNETSEKKRKATEEPL